MSFVVVPNVLGMLNIICYWCIMNSFRLLKLCRNRILKQIFMEKLSSWRCILFFSGLNYFSRNLQRLIMLGLHDVAIRLLLVACERFT